jgi:hypothetical protein
MANDARDDTPIATGAGRLSDRSALDYAEYALDTLSTLVAVFRALFVGAAAGLIAFVLVVILAGELAGWVAGILVGVFSAGWSMLQDDGFFPGSGLSLRRDGLRADVRVAIFRTGISIDGSPLGAWIVERVERRGDDRVELIVASRDTRTTLTIRTRKPELVAHLEKHASSSGQA